MRAFALRYWAPILLVAVFAVSYSVELRYRITKYFGSNNAPKSEGCSVK